MASLTGQLVAETYKALLKLIDNDILTASEKQITDGFGGGSNVFIDSQGFLRANKYKVTNGLATQFLKADGSLDSNAYLTSITGAQVITALGYTPVPTTRTITINGETHNLAADNSWTVGGTAAVWGNITGTLSNQTDLQNALNAKYNVPAGTISQYIRGDGTLATFPTLPGGLPIGGTAGQILAKIDATDYNTHWIDNFATQTKNEVKLGQTLAKGAAVYVSSANGTNMIVSAASNTSEALSSKTFGLLETGGVTNDLVKCVTFGLLAGLDTSTAQAGDPVWLGVNGALIFGLANKPYAPKHLVYIGVVTRVQSNNGEIFVNIQNGFELKEIHDVYIADPANNHGLFYDIADGLWKNKSIVSALGYTPQAQLSGTGFVKASGTTITYDNSTYLTTTDAASTYQRLDKMVSNLLPSATEYPNSNAVIAALALKADAANPVFTGNMTISGAEPKLYFTDTDQNPDYFIGVDAGFFRVYDQTAGATRFVINSDGNISTGVGKSITAGSFIKEGGTSSQVLMADGSVSALPSLSGYVPYTGATTSVNLGSYAITANRIYGNYSGVLDTYTLANPSTNVLLMSSPNDRDAWIFLDQAATTSNWGIYHRNIDSTIANLPANSIGFIGGGTSTLQSYISLQNGNAYFAGNLSVGTTIPFSTARLQIKTDTNVNIGFQTGTTDSSGIKLNAYNDLGSLNIPLELNGSILLLKTAESERIRITSGGNSLFNTTTNPTLGGFTNTTVLIKQIADGTAGGGLQIEANGSDNVAFFGFDGGAFRIGTSYRSTGSYQPIDFTTNGSIRLRISTTGNLLVGTTSDSGYKFDVNGTGRYIGRLTITDTGSAYPILLNNQNNEQYLSIESAVAREAMTRYYNPTAGNWYTGIRSSNGISSGSSYHIYSSTYGGDVMACDVGGNTILAGKLLMGYTSLGSSLIQVNGNIRMGTWTTAGSRYLGYTRDDDGSWGTGGASGFEIESVSVVGNYSQNVHLWTHWYNNGSNRALTARYDGNVGIGTTSPSSRLSLGTGVGAKFLVFDNGSSVYAGLGQDVAAGNSTDFFCHGLSNLGFLTFGKIGTNKTTYTEWMRIDPNGRVGIGTVSPTNKLHVTSSDNEGIFMQGTSNGGHWFNFRSANSNLWSMGAQPGLMGWYNRTDGSYKMVITDSGNVLISDTTDNGLGKLQVNGNIILAGGSSSGQSMLSSGFTTIRFPNQYSSGYTDAGVKLFIFNSGATIQGFTAGPSYDLQYHSSGSSSGRHAFYVGNTEIIRFNQTTVVSTGSITATSFFESSDIRLKKLIESNPIINGIEKLEAKLYEKNGKIEMGYFAQDAELIMPYAVTKNADGFLNLSYREIHTAKIARLEQRVAELEKQLNLN